MRVLLLSLITACAVDDLSESADPIKTRPKLVQVCWLDGVNGPLSDAPPPKTPPKGQQPPPPVDHHVRVYYDGTTDFLNATGEVACAMIDEDTLGQVEWGYDGKGFQNTSYTGNANTWCFLDEIEGNGLSPGSLTLNHTGNTWSFSGSYAGSTSFSTFAHASCFDVNAGSRWGYTLTATTDLRDYYPGGPQVPTAGVTCGLTGLRGSWFGSSKGWLDTSGTYLTYDLAGSVAIDVSCFR